MGDKAIKIKNQVHRSKSKNIWKNKTVLMNN